MQPFGSGDGIGYLENSSIRRLADMLRRVYNKNCEANCTNNHYYNPAACVRSSDLGGYQGGNVAWRNQGGQYQLLLQAG